VGRQQAIHLRPKHFVVSAKVGQERSASGRILFEGGLEHGTDLLKAFGGHAVVSL
jgi:hypothetical protein